MFHTFPYHGTLVIFGVSKDGWKTKQTRLAKPMAKLRMSQLK
jgi:hypothetical protein